MKKSFGLTTYPHRKRRAGGKTFTQDKTIHMNADC